MVSWNFFWNGHFWIFPTIFGGLNTPPHYQVTKIVMNLVCKSTHRQFYKKHFGNKRARVWGTMKIKDRHKLVFQKDKKNSSCLTLCWHHQQRFWIRCKIFLSPCGWYIQEQLVKTSTSPQLHFLTVIVSKFKNLEIQNLQSIPRTAALQIGKYKVIDWLIC